MALAASDASRHARVGARLLRSSGHIPTLDAQHLWGMTAGAARELRMLRQVHYPNSAAFFGGVLSGADKPRVHMVSEWIHGSTPYRYIAEHAQQLGESARYVIVRQICWA